MKKTHILLVCIVALVVLFLSLHRTKVVVDSGVIKIGVIAPQTGAGAGFGVPLMKGVELALQDLKASNPAKVYEVVFEDDAGNAGKAASAAQKLINVDHVQAILTVTGGTANAVKPIAEASKVIHIADTADSTVGSGDYNFTNSIVPTDEMPAWLHEAKDRGVRKLAVIYQKHPGMMPSVSLIQKLAPEYDIQVVSYEGFDPKETDFRTIALKAKSSGADTYFIAAYPPSLDSVTRSLKQIGEENISTYSLFAISPTPELYNGKWYTDANLADTSFMERFSKAYPEVRFNVRTAPYGYDMFNLVVSAIGSGNASVYLKNTEQVNGKVGNIIKEKGGNNFRSAPALWTIENGKPVLSKTLSL
jgi:ABC-type branched-subunit amino acid transport system substrate-binding protein